MTRLLVRETEASQVSFLPASIVNHGSKGTNGKCVAQRMISNHYATSVSMTIDAMTTSDSLENEAICFQCSHETARLHATWDSRHTLTATEGSCNSIVP